MSANSLYLNRQHDSYPANSQLEQGEDGWEEIALNLLFWYFDFRWILKDVNVRPLLGFHATNYTLFTFSIKNVFVGLLSFIGILNIVLTDKLNRPPKTKTERI